MNFETQEWRDFIQKFYEENTFWADRILANRHSELKAHIDKVYKPYAICDAAKFYHYVNNIKEHVTCKECNKRVTLFRAGKYGIFCGKKCAMSSAETIEKIAQTNIVRHGGRSAQCNPLVRDKYKQTVMNRYDVDNPLKSVEGQEKRRASMKRTGQWIDHDIEGFRQYELEVRRVTRKQNISSLPNYHLRGRKKGTFHLDHKYSTFEGFKNGIDAKMIGNILNLEYIPCSENCSKAAKCSISKEQLLDYFK